MSVNVYIKCRTQMCPYYIPLTMYSGLNRVAWTCLECGTVNEYRHVWKP